MSHIAFRNILILSCLAATAAAPSIADACVDGRPCLFENRCPGTWDCFAPNRGVCVPGDGCPVIPNNDDFANAMVLPGFPVTITGTTAGATREPGEPDHYTENKPDASAWLGDHTVWYRWTAPTGGPITVSADVCIGQIDSIVSVYTGSALTALTKIVDNNNDNCGGGFGAKATFVTVPGVTYDIAVGDAGGARESSFTLRLH